MKVVLAILTFLAMFAMFCAKDHEERKMHTIAYVVTVLGMVVLVILEWVKLWA